MSNAHAKPVRVSFEVFPVSDEVAQAKLRRCVGRLTRFRPDFVSVTYGADGSDRSRTLRVIESLRSAHDGLPVAGHLTCAGGTRQETLEVARHYAKAGAEWVVALRGDGQNGAGGAFRPCEDGFRDAPELITALRDSSGLKIAVGGYPEPHPDSRGAAADIAHLKRKVDAGADAIVTQFFFDNDDFFRFVDRCRDNGIGVPIVPGIMPIRNFGRIARFAARCGASVPARLAERFEKAEARGAARDLALAVCAGQCDELRDQGVDAFHFYTLNDADLSENVCIALGLDPSQPVGGDGAAVSADRLTA